MFLGFIKSFYPGLDIELFPNFVNSLIGGVVGYLIIWTIIFLYKKIRNKEGMGLGDAKLLSLGIGEGGFGIGKNRSAGIGVHYNR